MSRIAAITASGGLTTWVSSSFTWADYVGWFTSSSLLMIRFQIICHDKYHWYAFVCSLLRVNSCLFIPRIIRKLVKVIRRALNNSSQDGFLNYLWCLSCILSCLTSTGCMIYTLSTEESEKKYHVHHTSHVWCSRWWWERCWILVDLQILLTQVIYCQIFILSSKSASYKKCKGALPQGFEQIKEFPYFTDV